MSGDLVGADADEQIEVMADDRPPFTMCPDWVMFCPELSPQAKTLYWALAAHVNSSRDDGQVWPTREVLADLLQFNRPQSVDRYAQELVAVSALRIEQRRVGRMKVRNRYFVRFNAPATLASPSTIKEYYEARRARQLATAALPSSQVREFQQVRA